MESANIAVAGNGAEHTRQADSPLMGPASLALLTLVAGPAISGPAAGAVLVRLGRGKTGRTIGTAMALAGPAIYAALLLWPVKWYWSALTLLAIHLGLAAAVYYGMRTLYARLPELYATRFSAGRRQEKKYLLFGMISGTVMSVFLGGAATIFFLLGSDRMLATIMPVASSDQQSLIFFFTALLSLACSGFIAGGYMGRNALRATPMQMLLLTATLIAVSLAWLLTLELVIAVPGFQAGQAAGTDTGAAWLPFIGGSLLIGTWWVPFIFCHIIKPAGFKAKLLRFALMPVIHLSAGITLIILLGFDDNIFHAAGKYLERRARIPVALWCYEQGLKKNPSAASASYLQYRVALLAHKLGDKDRALKGFRNVVSKYTSNERLVTKSNRFLDNMARNTGDRKRVTLPGVEAHIAYKSSYCVPNSLALVMRFWGAAVDARSIGAKITGLSRGTMIVDQAWYAEQQGFRHDFLPNAGLSDIKASIDAGFPVMVYVPAHVFVIVGYDDILDTFVTYDVATSDVWEEYIQKDFIKSWKRQSATLVLAYPPGKEQMIPEDIRQRLVNLSGGYLHYHLYHAEPGESFAGSAHLLQAAGSDEAFFAPLAILYRDFPGLRPLLDDRFSKDKAADAISKFFSSDFDEGTHLWGQYHDMNHASEDWMLEYSLSYLIAQRQLQRVRDLITTIEEQGLISGKTLNTRGMIDMAQGDFENGIHRLSQEGDASGFELYLALAQQQLGNSQAAVSNLVETVDGCT